MSSGKKLAAVALAAAMLGARSRPASAHDDDAGFVPPDRATLRCEDALLGLHVKQIGRLGRCHLRQMSKLFRGKVADETRQEACVTAAQSKTSAAARALVTKRICTHPCNVGVADVEFGEAADVVAPFMPIVACEGGVPWPGDEHRNAKVPSSRPVHDCERGVARAALRLAMAIHECQRKQVRAAFNERPFSPEECHEGAERRYDRAVSRLSGCPACLRPAQVKLLVSAVEESAGTSFYCVSASGEGS